MKGKSEMYCHQCQERTQQSIVWTPLRVVYGIMKFTMTCITCGFAHKTTRDPMNWKRIRNNMTNVEE